MHKNEKILKAIKPSRWEFLVWYLIGILTIWFIIGIVFIIMAELLRGANTYYITSKRVIHEYTLLSRKTSSASYDKIQDLHTSQNIIERIIGIGTIHINTAGTHFVEIAFKGVSEPFSVKRMIDAKVK